MRKKNETPENGQNYSLTTLTFDQSARFRHTGISGLEKPCHALPSCGGT